MMDKSMIHARSALVASCLMLCMWVGLWWNCVTLYADPIIGEWGISRTQFMLVATIMALTNAVVQMFFYGKIQARLGIRRYIMLGGIVCTCGIALIASSKSLIAFYLGAFLFGSMVGGITNNPVTEILNSWYKKNVGRLIGVTQTASSIAGIFFSLVIAMLVRRMGWRLPVWITAIASGLTTAIVLFLYKGSPKELGENPMYADVQTESGEKEDGIPYKSIFRTPQFYLLSLGYILVPMVAQGALSNLPLITADLGYGNLSGTFLSVALIASAVFFVPAGMIIDKMGTKWMVTVGIFFFEAACFLLRFTTPSLVQTYMVAALIGAASDVCQLPFGISVREAFGSLEYSRKLGIIAAFVFFALAFGPSVMTLFYDLNGDYQLAISVFMVMGLIGTAAVHFGTKRVEK